MVPGSTAASSTVTTAPSLPLAVPAPGAVATVAPVPASATTPAIAPVAVSAAAPDVTPVAASAATSIVPVVAAEAGFTSSALAFIGIATIAPVIANAATCTFKFFFFIFILPVFRKAF